MQLDIITPDAQLFSGEVTSVNLPGIDGELGILNNHAPMITTLKKGVIILTQNGNQQQFETNGGVVEVLNNKVIVLAE